MSTEINNCDEYLKAINAGFFPGNNYDVKRSADFVHQCFVLRDLRNARPAISGNPYSWTDNSLAQLPPMLVVGAREITDAAEQAGKRGESWLLFNPSLKVTKIDGDSFQAEDDDLTYYLEILARGDFNGDGIEDIAVYGSAQGKQSSWSHSEYLILSPTNHAKLARLTSDRIPYEIKPRIQE